MKNIVSIGLSVKLDNKWKNHLIFFDVGDSYNDNSNIPNLIDKSISEYIDEKFGTNAIVKYDSSKFKKVGFCNLK